MRKLNRHHTHDAVLYHTDFHRTNKSSPNKKKLSQKKMIEEYVHRGEVTLNHRIDDALNEVESDFHAKWGRIVDAGPEFKDDLRNRRFLAQARVVKSTHAAYKKMIAHIEQNYKKEIRYSKDDKYVLQESPQWMMHDEEIVEALEKYPFTIPILNFLWNQNRFARGEELRKMHSLTKEVTGGKCHITEKKKKHEYATFVTNAEFYKIISEKIRCSKNYLQKYLIAFDKIGIIKKLGNIGRNGTLYANGYYVPYGDKLRKETFLKNSREFKIALRSFNPLASQHVQKMKLLRRR